MARSIPLARRVLGLDPGLRITGFGIVNVEGTRLRHIASGTVRSDEDESLGERLRALHEGLRAVIERFQPDEAAIEETFVNKNPGSTLKLGQARGVVMLAPAQAGLIIAEYAPNAVKKAVVGVGHASKDQVHAMVRILLASPGIEAADAADALAVAICHCHHAPPRVLTAAAARLRLAKA